MKSNEGNDASTDSETESKEDILFSSAELDFIFFGESAESGSESGNEDSDELPLKYKIPFILKFIIARLY